METFWKCANFLKGGYAELKIDSPSYQSLCLNSWLIKNYTESKNSISFDTASMCVKTNGKCLYLQESVPYYLHKLTIIYFYKNTEETGGSTVINRTAIIFHRD